jgi:tRNA-uridine 2-sulfurtransferase
MARTKPKAVVAMSGGVDSSVAAALLVDAGYDVTGVMLKLWRGEAANTGSGCCNLGAAEDARRVADVLGIPFYCLNFAERFEDTVVRNFNEEYALGRTPNPCVRCNQWIKFDALFDRARALGAEVLATGHYARIRERGGRHRLLRGIDAGKDQSYVLWMLSARQLAHCRFPVGEMEKSQTRRVAEELGLRTARKPDSQEICFVRAGDTSAYIDEHLPAAALPGPILDGAGRRVGRHRGIGHYTIGQRKGLGISLGEPVFVSSIDKQTNSISVGSRRDLETEAFLAEEISFSGPRPPTGIRLLVQHRAHGETNPATLHGFDGRRGEVRFETPVAALAPGQSAAFYSSEDPEELIGGGVIASTVGARVGA